MSSAFIWFFCSWIMEVDWIEKHKWSFPTILYRFVTNRADWNKRFLHKFFLILHILLQLGWLLLCCFDLSFISVLDITIVFSYGSMLCCAQVHNLTNNRRNGSRFKIVLLGLTVPCNLFLYENAYNFFIFYQKCVNKLIP